MKNLPSDAYFYSFLQKHLVAPLGIGNFVSMRGEDGNIISCPAQYERRLEAALNSETRIAELAGPTLEDNFSGYTESDIPRYGLTLGLKRLRAVRRTVLIASGKPKAAAVQKLLSKTSALETPACALWKNSDFGVIIDADAASLLDGRLHAA